MRTIRKNLFQFAAICLFLGALISSFTKESIGIGMWLIVAGVLFFILDVICDRFIKESTDDKKNIKGI